MTLMCPYNETYFYNVPDELCWLNTYFIKIQLSHKQNYWVGCIKFADQVNLKKFRIKFTFKKKKSRQGFGTGEKLYYDTYSIKESYHYDLINLLSWIPCDWTYLSQI